MSSRKRQADVSVRDLQREVSGEEPVRAQVESEEEEESEEPIDMQKAIEEGMRAAQADPSRRIIKLKSRTPSSEVLETPKPEEADLKESKEAENTPPQQEPILPQETTISTDSGAVQELSTRREGEEQTTSAEAAHSPKPSEPELPAKADAGTPFKITGSIFGNFQLPTLPPSQVSNAGDDKEPDSPSLQLTSDDKASARPKSFPGEENESVVHSDFSSTLLKCVNVNEGSEEAAKYKFKALGQGVVRLLKSEDNDGRLVFRQNGTWHVLLNSPKKLISKVEKLDTPSSFLIKFFAYDASKELATNKLSVYSLKFPESKTRDQLYQHMLQLVE